MQYWNADYMIRDLCIYRGPDKLTTSMKKLSIVSEVAVTNTNVDDIIVNGKLIGEGEFGKTYFYNEKIIKLVEIKSTKQLKNEIESARHNQDLQSLHYKTFEKKGTKSISALCACPILSGGTSKDIVVGKDRKKYFWFEMLKCVPYHLTNSNVKNFLLNVVAACKTIVLEGYLHNDFHMQNVMLYENQKGKLHPIIIDFGMIKHIPDFKENYSELTDILTFSQISTFFDNCNSNTKCLQDVEAIQSVFDFFRKSTTEMFGTVMDSTDSLEYAKEVAKFIEKSRPSLPLLIKVNLLVAQLSNKYFAFDLEGCGFTEPEWCGNEDDSDEKSSDIKPIKTAGDVIYGIRSPDSMTHDELWKFLTIETLKLDEKIETLKLNERRTRNRTSKQK